MSRQSITSRPVPGVNLIRLNDGREIHIDDIATAAEAQAVLNEVEGAILGIEDAIAHDTGSRGPDWRRRAESALRRKRRHRPSLQRRLSELRHAERPAVPQKPSHRGGSEARDARRKAFINAAEDLLPAETFTEIWARAAELDPVAFAQSAEAA